MLKWHYTSCGELGFFLSQKAQFLKFFGECFSGTTPFHVVIKFVNEKTEMIQIYGKVNKVVCENETHLFSFTLMS